MSIRTQSNGIIIVGNREEIFGRLANHWLSEVSREELSLISWMNHEASSECHVHPFQELGWGKFQLLWAYFQNQCIFIVNISHSTLRSIEHDSSLLTSTSLKCNTAPDLLKAVTIHSLPTGWPTTWEWQGLLRQNFYLVSKKLFKE
jgi:hypothetical protein